MRGKYKKIKSFFSRSKIIIIVSLFLMLYLTVNLTKEIIGRHQIDRNIENYQADIDRIESENHELSSMIASWQGSAKLEKEARLKLGLQKTGESAVLILRDDQEDVGNFLIKPNSQIIGGTVIAGEADNISNPLKWWRYFFINHK